MFSPFPTSTKGHHCTKTLVKMLRQRDSTVLRNCIISIPFPETLIYTVNPTMTSPTLLASPNWPKGMRPYSTISWIVALPSQYKAHLQFVNLSQPKCADRHTAIKVKMLGYEEELMSRREDEPAEDELLVPHSFYLNMSNCMPEEGHFGAITKIILLKKTSKYSTNPNPNPPSPTN